MAPDRIQETSHVASRRYSDCRTGRVARLTGPRHQPRVGARRRRGQPAAGTGYSAGDERTADAVGPGWTWRAGTARHATQAHTPASADAVARGVAARVGRGWRLRVLGQ